MFQNAGDREYDKGNISTNFNNRCNTTENVIIFKLMIIIQSKYLYIFQLAIYINVLIKYNYFND